jgi:hypothetical protein
MTGPTSLKRCISESRRRAAKSHITEIPRCLAARCLKERVVDKIFSLAGGERRVFWPSTFVVIPIGGNQQIILSFREIKGSGLPGFS